MPPRSIGLIGLGVIGQIYAGHLLRANGELIVCDVAREKVRQAAARGATPAGSAREVAAGCDFVFLSLPAPEAVETILLGPDGVLAGARPGTLIIDTSTIDPDTCARMFAAAKARGVDYLEAPVSGGEPGGAGTDGARAANVSFMVGGDQAAFERARPVMSILGKRFFYLGPAGRGSTIKLISNLMAGLHNLVATEAFVLGAAAGFSPETLLEVFDGTDARSFWLTEYFAPRIRRQDFEPGFSVDLQYKDHRLAADLARRLKVPLLLNDIALQVYQMLRAQGLGQKDLVEAVNFWGRLADIDIYHPRPAGSTTEAENPAAPGEGSTD